MGNEIVNRTIPKIIHYCWFGNGSKDELTLRCIESWKKVCPDYEILEWNESNSDIHANIFVEEAYKCKKWAFVSDYIRLVKLYEYGGIYLDTDVELIKSMDDFLKNNTFFGYAEETCIGSSTIGSVKSSGFIAKLIEHYSERHFVKPDSTYDDVPNNVIITQIAVDKYGFKMGDTKVGEEVKIYPTEYFSPFRKRIVGKEEILYSHNNFIITDDVYAIHYNSLSWINVGIKVKVSRISKQIIRSLFPHKVFWKIKSYLFWKKINK